MLPLDNMYATLVESGHSRSTSTRSGHCFLLRIFRPNYMQMGRPVMFSIAWASVLVYLLLLPISRIQLKIRNS